MTTKPGLFRYWGDRKPDTSKPILTFTRPTEAAKTAKAEAASSGGDAPKTVGTLRIYGPIDSWGGWWGVSAKDVSRALDQLGDIDQLVVRINSPGGEAFEGRAIMNMLRAHKAQCVGVVDGLAASAASYIAVGCDETVMAPGTELMIHDTHAIVYGDAAELRKQADVVDSISRSGSELYADIAGGTAEQWRELQRAETWYTAAEAVESGLADRVGIVPDAGPAETAQDDQVVVVAPEGEDLAAAAAFDLSIFHFAGREQAPAPKPPTASAGGSTHTEGGSAVAFSDEQVTTMRQKLGIAEDADEATILAALDEALEERTDPPAEATIPEGHVVIPKAQLDDLTAGAEQARKTAQQLHDEKREEFLDANRSKYLPANRDAWAKEYDRDPDATRDHFKTAADLVPVSELGHAQGGDAEALASDADYLALFPDEKQPEKKGA